MSEPTNLVELDAEIQAWNARLDHAASQRDILVAQRRHLAQMGAISHEEAVTKLRDIYRSAVLSDGCRDFNLSIIEDLKRWFDD